MGRSNIDLHTGSLESRDNAPVEVDPEADRMHREARGKQYGIPSQWVTSIAEVGKGPVARFTGMYLGGTGNKSLIRATEGGGPDGTEIDWKSDPTGYHASMIGKTYEWEGKWNPEKHNAGGRYYGGMEWSLRREAEQQMPVDDDTKKFARSMIARSRGL